MGASIGMLDKNGHAMGEEELCDALKLRHQSRLAKLREILCAYIHDEALLSSVIAAIAGNILKDLEVSEWRLEDLD
jgi:hypothetical protein